MTVKEIIYENFQDYKKPHMLIATCYCDFKCGDFCQNKKLVEQANINIENEIIYNKYIYNPITNAIVIGGLEPMKQFNEIIDLIKFFRNKNCNDDFVIYTGYQEFEISEEINTLSKYKNIIIKFGKFILNDEETYDDILGVNLLSKNQYAKKIS